MWADIYVLAPSRSKKIIERFQEDWLVGMDESAEDYWFPYYEEANRNVFKNADALIEQLLLEPTEPYAIYWMAPKNAEVKGGMLFFTKDGEMVVGLSIETVICYENGIAIGEVPPPSAQMFLEQLLRTIDGKYGYVTVEQPPDDTKAEFIKEAQAFQRRKA